MMQMHGDKILSDNCSGNLFWNTVSQYDHIIATKLFDSGFSC